MKRRAALQLLAAFALAACAAESGAVEPVWGKQACAHCAMILSDRRFGAQLVTDAGDRLFFDDVGCMVLAIEGRGLGAARAWAHDAQTGRWLEARSARYVAGAPSPMDFGFEARAGEGVGGGAARSRQSQVAEGAMSAAVATRAFLRLELNEALRLRWLAFTGAVYALVFSGFIWLGLRESSILGFTGLSRVVLNMANAVALVVPLVALVASSPCVVRARQSGFFELMLSQPARRADWFASIVLSRFLVVVGPLAALFTGALVAGPLLDASDSALAGVVARSLATTAALAWAFLGIGFWISAAARSPERATVVSLLAWVASSALHDFALVGVLLRFKLAPAIVFALAALNPAEAARIAILSGVDPDLSALGPVGFWLANTLGPRLALAVGVGWPALLGTFAMWRAQRRLVRSDLVG